MAGTLAASGGSISDAVVEFFPSTQEIPAVGPECLNSASTSQTPPYSPRIATMIQKRKRGDYSSQVESDIASSKDHWTAGVDEEESEDDKEKRVALLEANRESEDDEEKRVALLEANREAFENLKSHPGWGPFFSRDSIPGGYWAGGQVGNKIAEGGQAEIHESLHYNFLVFKVFKRGTLLQDLQKKWPQTVFDDNKSALGPLIRQGYLLDDGRFALVMRRFWGDLRRFMDLRMVENNNSGPPFSLREIYALVPTVAYQMSHLHDRDICHNDLKAANILVTRDGSRILDIRIADYECSIGARGTTFWKAPEILLAERNFLSARGNGNEPPPPSLPFSKAADVYSYGMLLYEICTGYVPFELEGFFNYESQENCNRVIGGERPQLPDEVALHFRDLITMCWREDAEQRPTFKEIKDYMRSLRWDIRL